MKNHVMDNFQGKSIEKEEVTDNSELISSSGYNRSTHNDVRPMINEGLKMHIEDNPRNVTDNICAQVVFALF